MQPLSLWNDDPYHPSGILGLDRGRSRLCGWGDHKFLAARGLRQMALFFDTDCNRSFAYPEVIQHPNFCLPNFSLLKQLSY